ncbi:hypothetical protein ACFCV3_37745 [Kribbella sp. NPDC056345]|uniref:hypothetical protein n=1 Tax=Kribbella sp. NPDC056345 TaxID=3345789 RepID=UPI0035DF557E
MTRRTLQVIGTAVAGAALATALLVGLHRPGARLWTTAASFSLTVAAQLRCGDVPTGLAELFERS